VGVYNKHIRHPSFRKIPGACDEEPDKKVITYLLRSDIVPILLYFLRKKLTSTRFFV